MFLGIGAVFAIHLFTDSQAVLFKGVDTDLLAVNLGALLVADILIVRSLFRGKPLNVSIHLSHQFLYNSITVLIVGIYFISVGAVAWASLRFEWIKNIHISIFLVFVLIIGLATILLSDRLRLKRKRFISRHLKRPQYDYQKIWEDFTARTAPANNIRDLCRVIVTMVSETLEILSVSIWLVDEKQESLSFGGSTVFTEEQVRKLKLLDQGGADLIRAMSDQTMPVDLEGREDDWVADLKRTHGLETRESRIRYCVPLNAAGHLVGIMTLSEKVFYEPLSFEESELVRTIADQAAAGLLNLTLAEHLRQARELEAFQTMSAFFMHDLKNLASKLSLVTQNLPVHMDNPEFRSDALRTISQSVSKINNMSSRLSLLSQKLDLVFRETDLNELVAEVLADAKDYVKAPASQSLDPLPPVSIDREQIHKVLENLLMNAYDALKQDGQITVTTHAQDNWAEIAVRDNGCGMSNEFMEKQLFRPFQTTKKQGMGIGLYHCKTIVEAHGGRIHAESEEGKGTTFRVLLPVTK
jgi:putative PEP-CTERM system histidine kinase